ncbi:MAG TPA: hypothetical protein VGD37_43115 [Kofleriaceae bacterium]
MELRTRCPFGALILAAALCGGATACGTGCSSPHSPTLPGDGSPGDGGRPSDGGGPSDGSGGPPPGDAGPAAGPLRVDPVNPRYFSAGGKVVYLTGSHTWGNLKDRAHVDPPPAFDYAGFLDFLTAHHHNFMRLWTWEQPHSFDDDPQNLLYFAQFPWQRTGPGTASDGKPRFDLDKLDPAYFTRLRARVSAARDRGIYVSVMLFDGWDLANAYNPTSGGFPLGAGNNVNGVAATGPEAITLAIPAVTARQEAYVRAVIDAVNDLDNVLYEIANETDNTAIAWQYHMIDFVKAVEAGKPQRHPVGMTSAYPGGVDDDLFASHADWISPVGQLVPGDGRKVILNDTDHSYGWTQLKGDGVAAQRAWVWQTFCIGAAPLFMDPYLEIWAGRNSPSGGRPDPAWDPIRDALGRTRRYADRLNLERAVPSSRLCSTGYCLAEPGHQYLVYKPTPPPSGGASFTLTVASGAYRFEWFNPATGQVVDTGMMTLPAETHTFTPPFTGDAVLLLLSP